MSLYFRYIKTAFLKSLFMEDKDNFKQLSKNLFKQFSKIGYILFAVYKWVEIERLSFLIYFPI